MTGAVISGGPYPPVIFFTHAYFSELSDVQSSVSSFALQIADYEEVPIVEMAEYAARAPGLAASRLGVRALRLPSSSNPILGFKEEGSRRATNIHPIVPRLLRLRPTTCGPPKLHLPPRYGPNLNFEVYQMSPCENQEKEHCLSVKEAVNRPTPIVEAGIQAAAEETERRDQGGWSASRAPSVMPDMLATNKLESSHRPANRRFDSPSAT
ncbi:hypothetical protein HPB50_014872 [Hyalomma asiaticum]|uniref:Uncharacterized protein n=1 Tax=Hyalomma asiaticum TaxID=266040 RepID=A0ACB7THW0_HYAAI|nr:hypothetical protein HPB50_014872 [Hyalomma asiaticum]